MSPSRRTHSPLLKLCYKVDVISLYVAEAIVPSWLRPAPSKHSPTKPTVATAYLDGLRGIVALLVFVRHFTLPWQLDLDYGYGYEGYDGFLRLPFLRLLFSGPLTPVFFIVSGYVLSAKSLKLSRQKAWEPLVLALAGSAFRRALRLFLVPTFSTFWVMVLAYFGLLSFPYGDMPGRQPIHPIALGAFWAQLKQWGIFVMNELTNPWRWDIPRLTYGPHLWTIPVSFKGSLIVFLSCLVLIRTKGITRLVLMVLGILSTLWRGRWDMAPFLAGMLLCELDLRNGERLSHSKIIDRTRPRLYSMLKRVFSWACFIVGLYLGSFPRKNNAGNACVAGFQWCCHITSNYRYWHCIGAFFAMLGIANLRILQWPLKTSPVLYLGKISFSFYIIHEPFLHLFGFYTVPFFWRWTGDTTELQRQAGFLAGMLFSIFWLLWLADLFKQYVEDRCVTLAKWVESKVLC